MLYVLWRMADRGWLVDLMAPRMNEAANGARGGSQGGTCWGVGSVSDSTRDRFYVLSGASARYISRRRRRRAWGEVDGGGSASAHWPPLLGVAWVVSEERLVPRAHSTAGRSLLGLGGASPGARLEAWRGRGDLLRAS